MDPEVIERARGRRVSEEGGDTEVIGIRSHHFRVSARQGLLPRPPPKEYFHHLPMPGLCKGLSAS